MFYPGDHALQIARKTIIWLVGKAVLHAIAARANKLLAVLVVRYNDTCVQNDKK